MKEVLPLLNIDSEVLRKVIDWCEHHKNDQEPEKEEESKDGERKQKQIVKLEGWDEEFMSTINYINEQGQSILFDIIIAANYLHIICGEKKARKAMSKIDLRQVPGIDRATIKKSKNILFVINNPDVYKIPATETHIIFGAAKMEDLSQNAQMEAASKFTAKADPPQSKSTKKKQDLNTIEEVAMPEDEVDEEINDDGLDAKDIELVMSQANVNKSRAIKALRNSGNDVVKSITKITI